MLNYYHTAHKTAFAFIEREDVPSWLMKNIFWVWKEINLQCLDYIYGAKNNLLYKPYLYIIRCDEICFLSKYFVSCKYG